MPKQQQLDLSFVKSATLLMPATETWRFVLVGCGGTGSWLAPSVARTAYVLQQQGKEVGIWFVDPDHVEEKNIPRQNFCQAELGMNKAVTLAARFGAAWGVEITALPQRYEAGEFRRQWNANTILIGCVDNAAARKTISSSLQSNDPENPHRVWWLDCGNMESSGQVLFGSCLDQKALAGAFVGTKICKALPCPSLVAPDLLVPRPEESRKNKLSCADIQLANAQSLAVNQQVAAIATDYLIRITHGGLKRYATYFDLESGSARSLYISQDPVLPPQKKVAQKV